MNVIPGPREREGMRSDRLMYLFCITMCMTPMVWIKTVRR